MRCSLHLGQEFNRVNANTRPRPILSKKSAPGLIIATGNTGDRVHLDETAGIYLSADAGWSWSHVSYHINSLTTKKQTTKFSSANFQKNLSLSYIILRIQRL